MGLFIILAAASTGGHSDNNHTPEVVETRPNILLIVADDLGYTDLGAFGGEIHTPNLDQLAMTGLRLTNFHTGPSCSPTRAMLMTGTDHHIAGVGSQGRLQTPNQTNSPAYTNSLLPSVPTVAEHLGKLGYRNLASAKWHLGKNPEALPNRRGFHRSFVLLEGGAGHFDDTPLFESYGKAGWLENDQPTELPEGFYSSDHMTDKILSYIRETPTGQPWFAFLGYTAPHWPLQAPPEAIAPYQGVYAGGWDHLRNKRMQGAIAAGVANPKSQAVAYEAGMVPWDTLSAADQVYAAKKMQIYAGMVHRMDENVGRLLKALEDSGALANTAVVFLSDNGAEAHVMENYSTNPTWLPASFDNSLQSVGTARSYVSLGPGWARATAAPFRASKSKLSEGGIRVPAFVHLPNGITGIDGSYMRVMDLAPTFIELAGGQVPDDMMGRSLLSRLTGGEPAYEADEVVAAETFGRRMAQSGDWKILLQEAPYGTGEWQLYNLAEDPGEQLDLSDQFPDRRTELIKAWQAFADETGVILPDEPIGY